MNRDKTYRNIVLIGMSGVGKTVVGKHIANKLNMEFIDTDDMIVSRSKKSIDDIFTKYGEEYFRCLEREVVKSLAFKKKVVISTGGGIVLDNNNMQILNQNGMVFLLKASIDTIVTNINVSSSNQEKRPLLKDSLCLRDRIREIYNYRKKLYINWAHKIIDVDNKTVEEISQEIIYNFREFNSCSWF